MVSAFGSLASSEPLSSDSLIIMVWYHIANVSVIWIIKLHGLDSAAKEAVNE